LVKTSIGAKTILYPTPVLIVATYDDTGKPNAMAAAWGGICCSRPPCVAVSLRKATYTYGNIVSRKAFTINIASERFVREADYFGIVSGRTEDKFVTTGLTAIKSELVEAPIIEEFPLVVECKLLHTIEIGLHTQFIGQVIDVKAEESALGEGGTPDIERVQPILYAPGNQAYYGIGRLLGNAFSVGNGLKSGG
jgi:flavin reductase (DIM6/NTAB) family NADH-FMN oxidoreductase RutF